MGRPQTITGFPCAIPRAKMRERGRPKRGGDGEEDALPLSRTHARMLIAALVVSLPAVGAGSVALARSTCGTWRPDPVFPNASGFPRDIEVASASETWLIGWEGFVAGSPVVLHRVGGSWGAERFPTPPGDGDDVDLADVVVTGSGAVWGVGHADRVAGGPAGLRPLAARWTGTGWRRIDVGIPRQASFNAVDGVPGTERLWAVGSYGLSTWGVGGGGTFVARWNGERWQRVPSPSPGVESHFMDVVAVGRSVWAVGAFREPGGGRRTLAARWNGRRWSVYRGPRGGLYAVDAVRPNLVWAVGPGKDLSPQRGLIRRWDGSSWSTVRRLREPSALLDVVVLSPTDAWAVGYRGRFPHRPFVMRRHGGSWRWANAPDTDGRFWAIDGTSRQLWALRWHTVGDSGRLDPYRQC